MRARVTPASVIVLPARAKAPRKGTIPSSVEYCRGLARAGMMGVGAGI